MKKLIIVGAGTIGKRAMDFFGAEYVEYFADNYKKGTKVYGKKVIGIEEMKLIKDEYLILLAVTNYLGALKQQLSDLGIQNYYYFQEEVYYINSLFPIYDRKFKEQKSLYRIISENDLYHPMIVGTEELLGRFVSEMLDCPMFTVGEAKKHSNQYTSFLLNVGEEELQNFRKHVPQDLQKRIFKFIRLEDFEIGKTHSELAVFKDRHKCQRCFIIGNGPSLSVRDLDILYESNEVCFGLNMIHKIYDKTKWRADYTCVCDEPLIRVLYEKIAENNKGIIFASDIKDLYQFKKTEKEFLYCELLTSKDQKLTPDFSFDITKGIAGGNTITYIALQICMYMGFAEIYLLGMDCSNFLHHFTDNYVDGKLEMDMNTLNVERMILAYKEAKRISEEKGIKIYNATRGGMLEVFERVNFDDLFKRQERDNRV